MKRILMKESGLLKSFPYFPKYKIVMIRPKQ
jgi:hypothetical protein